MNEDNNKIELIEPESAEATTTAITQYLKKLPRTKKYIQSLINQDDQKEVYRTMNEQISALQLALHEFAFAEMEKMTMSPSAMEREMARETFKDYVAMAALLAKHRSELFKALGLNLLPAEADKSRSLYAPKQMSNDDWQKEYGPVFDSFSGKPN